MSGVRVDAGLTPCATADRYSASSESHAFCAERSVPPAADRHPSMRNDLPRMQAPKLAWSRVGHVELQLSPAATETP